MDFVEKREMRGSMLERNSADGDNPVSPLITPVVKRKTGQTPTKQPLCCTRWKKDIKEQVDREREIVSVYIPFPLNRAGYSRGQTVSALVGVVGGLEVST